MAGGGSRLRREKFVFKPLIPIGDRPLISYAIDHFVALGVQFLHAIVGAKGDELAARLRPLIPDGMRLNVIPNPDWQKQNGVSLLQAEGKVAAPFFLTMGDHLFEASLLHKLVRGAQPDCLNLAIDRKIGSILDLDDAMKVRTRDNRVMAIDKGLADYDAIDTGVFLCPEAVFGYLRSAQREGDCSLADGVRLMAADGKVRAIDINSAWWQDVDTPEMLAHAERHLSELVRLES